MAEWRVDGCHGVWLWWRVGDCRQSWWRVGLRGVAIGAERVDGHSMRMSADKSGISRPTSLLGSEG